MDEQEVVAAFANSAGDWQVVTDDRCPTCGYPERHSIYRLDGMALIADGCPSCDTSRMPSADVEVRRRDA